MRAETRNTFEIVAAGEEGYRWRLVADGCELAESARTYGSRKRVRRAIAALRRADVVDLTSHEPRAVALPEARFALVEGVEPLIVGTPPRRRKHKGDDHECAAEQEAVAADLEAQAVEEAAVAQGLKGGARSEAAIAEELRQDAAAEAEEAAVLGDEEAAVEASAKATMADELEADATVAEAASQALEADAEEKAKRAGAARGQARRTRARRKPAS